MALQLLQPVATALKQVSAAQVATEALAVTAATMATLVKVDMAALVVLAARDNTNRVYDGSCVMSNLMNAAKAVGLASCWVHRAKEVFDSEEGKALLRQWGVEGDYEGIGHCILGYRADTAPAPAPRKEHYIYRVR